MCFVWAALICAIIFQCGYLDNIVQVLGRDQNAIGTIPYVSEINERSIHIPFVNNPFFPICKSNGYWRFLRYHIVLYDFFGYLHRLNLFVDLLGNHFVRNIFGHRWFDLFLIVHYRNNFWLDKGPLNSLRVVDIPLIVLIAVVIHCLIIKLQQLIHSLYIECPSINFQFFFQN